MYILCIFLVVYNLVQIALEMVVFHMAMACRLPVSPPYYHKLISVITALPNCQKICYITRMIPRLKDTRENSFDISLSLIADDLEGTEFREQALSVLTHFLNAGVTFPHVRDATFAHIRTIMEIKNCENLNSFSFVDLFAGIGGFRLGLQRQGGKAVFSSEWEKNAKNSYMSNHGDFPFGDITLFTNDGVGDNELGALIPSHDILAGGFPCQPFSRAGVSARNSLGIPHGFQCTTQGTLFHSIERIARVKQPKILFLENVKNLVSHDNGRTFATIKATIEGIGYNFFHAIINSETLVPQRRVRCFIIGVRNDVFENYGDFNFPSFEGISLPLKSVLERNPDKLYTISDKLWRGHINRSARNKARGTGFTTNVADLDKPSNTIVARYGKDGKECLIQQENMPPRMLTIDECRKLFGYPKNFKLPAYRTPAYKLLGNSVVVPVVEKLAEAICDQYLSSPNV